MAEARRPRWLHVFSTFGVGGPQRRTVQLIDRTPDVDHQVIAMDGRSEARELLANPAGLQLLDAPAGRLRPRLRGMRSLVHAQGPDLLLTYNWGAIEWLWAARGGAVPVVHHEEGFGPEEVQRRFLRRTLARRFILRRGAAVVVPSRNLEQIAREEWKVPASRVRFLANGVDLQRFHPAGGRPERPITFGVVGGLRAEKNPVLAVQALARMHDGTARLVLVGEGPERDVLANTIAHLGLESRVELRGYEQDPAALYRAFDALVIPSATEQMPLSLLEGMATGLPVAGTRVGDVAAMLASRAQQELLVPSGDASGLAAAMDRLAGDVELRSTLGAANRQRVEGEYELEACLGRYLALYRELSS